MKIAVVYNRESQAVINLFGQPNREKYGLAAINRIVNSLKAGGHQVAAFEGDKDLIDKLEEFMPRALAGERPGMVFNLSYGIQGQARYTHVPGILEMVGVPYVGSGPLAHSLALDKVVAKMLFVQHGLPTPEFAVLNEPGFELPAIPFPAIVKPKNESVSFGIRIVNDEAELREAAGVIFAEFSQPVLVERYIEGREINVGILGNGQPDAFEPAELSFGDTGPKIYTEDDKKRKSGREIGVTCPAPLDPAITAEAKRVAIGAFQALGCHDCARVDLRMDEDGKLYILEINSLPSLGEHGSYVAAAEQAGLDFAALINRLVEVAAARYFGTPNPPALSGSKLAPTDSVFGFLTERRDRLESRLEQWVGLSSHSDDPIGIQFAAEQANGMLAEIGLRPMPELTDAPHAWTWQSEAGLADGTLLIAHLDVPHSSALGAEHFHRDPEWLYGEGIASSRAPLVQLEFALKALRRAKQLKSRRLGVLLYADEGRDAVESTELIAHATRLASRVIVLRPGNVGDALISQRRGQRRYRLMFAGKPRKLGQPEKRPEVMRQAFGVLEKLAGLSDRRQRLAVSCVDLKAEGYPRLLPHRAVATLQVSFPDQEQAEALETKIKQVLRGSGAHLALLNERPAMPTRRGNGELFKSLQDVADQWQIPLGSESSLLPSVAGLVPERVPVLCGLGPVAQGLMTGQEAVSRISLVQRTLLLAQYLLAQR